LKNGRSKEGRTSDGRTTRKEEVKNTLPSGQKWGIQYAEDNVGNTAESATTQTSWVEVEGKPPRRKCFFELKGGLFLGGDDTAPKRGGENRRRGFWGGSFTGTSSKKRRVYSGRWAKRKIKYMSPHKSETGPLRENRKKNNQGERKESTLVTRGHEGGRGYRETDLGIVLDGENKKTVRKGKVVHSLRDTCNENLGEET